MKGTLLTIIAFMLLIGCGNPAQQETAIPQPVEVDSTIQSEDRINTEEGGTEYILSTSESSIIWRGQNKFTPKTHSGTIDFREGVLVIDDSTITKGVFIAEMNTISTIDNLTRLEEHLKNPDFFNVSAFPISRFEIASVKPLKNDNAHNFEITGNLTIKNITKQITFPAKINVSDSQVKATAYFKIDRTEWDIHYRSDSFFPDLVKDKVIKNEIEMQLVIVALSNAI